MDDWVFKLNWSGSSWLNDTIPTYWISPSGDLVSICFHCHAPITRGYDSSPTRSKGDFGMVDFSVAAHWLRSFHWTFMWVPCPMDFYHLILRSWQLNGCMTNITTLWNHSCHCLKLVVDVQNLGNGHDVLYLRHLHCCPGTLESMVIISGYSRGSWRSVSIGQVFL